ncbi:hypothetical protein BDW22DRAFT_1330929 [Trametopsis cervina]|nr:hypothetical protein BDW22DRAFT_1330929 [Trametopsis cervina]
MLPSGQQKRNEQQDKFPNNSKPYSKAAAKEARRSRGEIACAECRRLKVRCNRQVPCATCISRGCAALCPNGTLPPGDNSRFVTHATDHLQRLIGKMTDRMRALEDALAIAQAAESSQTHPLLSVEATQDIDVDINQEEEDEPETVDSVVESFGTLHIEDKGRTQRFFGPSGGSEKASLPGAHEDVGPIDLRALGLPQELDPFFHAFPLTPMAVPTAPMWNILRGFLPLRDRAEALGRIMLERLSWMFSTVSLRVYVEELLPYVYSSKEITSGDEDTSPYHGAHGFALFLIVLAIGSLMDPTLPPYNADAQRYYAMSVVALGLEPILARPNLSTVKTLHLVSIYCGMSGSESNMANQYAILNLACSVAQTVILTDVDPVHWNMSEKDVYDRRCCYWNILRADLWQSIYSGRPPALALTVGNCKMQTEHDEEKYQAHEYTIGFGVWGSRYSERCLLPAMKLLVASKQPTYEAVLRLDKEIVAFEQPSPDLHFDSPSIAESMRWFVRSHYKELIRLALHRGFFAQALASDDSSPLDSPYKLSFLTAYASACTVLNSTSISYSRHPDLLSRVWMIWSFGFSSAVIVGAVAARCKNLNISPPPFQALQDACTLFERASKTNSRAAVALV